MKKVIARIILAWSCMLPLYGLRVVADEYYWLSDLLGNGLMLIAAILVGWPAYKNGSYKHQPIP